MSVSTEIYESHTRALSEQVQALKAEVERLKSNYDTVYETALEYGVQRDEARAALAGTEKARDTHFKRYLIVAQGEEFQTKRADAAESRNAALVEALRSLSERGCACAFNEPEQGKCVTCEQVDAALEASPAPVEKGKQGSYSPDTSHCCGRYPEDCAANPGPCCAGSQFDHGDIATVISAPVRMVSLERVEAAVRLVLGGDVYRTPRAAVLSVLAKLTAKEGA